MPESVTSVEAGNDQGKSRSDTTTTPGGSLWRRRFAGHRAIVSNTGWLMGDRVLRMGVGLLVGVWVARYLGPAYFGTFNYAVAIVTIVGGLATLGLDSIVVREVLKSPQDAGEILGTSFVLKLGAGIAGVFLVIAAVRLLQPDDPLTQSVAAVLALGMLFQAVDPIDFWFQSQSRGERARNCRRWPIAPSARRRASCN